MGGRGLPKVPPPGVLSESPLRAQGAEGEAALFPEYVSHTKGIRAGFSGPYGRVYKNTGYKNIFGLLLFFGLGGIPSYTREYGYFWLRGSVSGAQTELFRLTSYCLHNLFPFFPSFLIFNFLCSLFY